MARTRLLRLLGLALAARAGGLALAPRCRCAPHTPLRSPPPRLDAPSELVGPQLDVAAVIGMLDGMEREAPRREHAGAALAEARAQLAADADAVAAAVTSGWAGGAGGAPFVPPPPSALSLSRACARAKSLLAASATAPAQLEAVADLAETLRLSGRLSGARDVCALALRRRGGAADGAGTPAADGEERGADARLRDEALLTAAALDDRAGYAAIETPAEPTALAARVVASAGAGWAAEALAANVTLHNVCASANFSAPPGAAVALMRMLLDGGGVDGAAAALDITAHRRPIHPPPPPAARLLAALAAAASRQEWKAARNLLSRPRLRVRWTAAVANAALAELLSRGRIAAAAGALSHMRASSMRLDGPAITRAALRCASATFDDPEETAAAFAALGREVERPDANAYLAAMRHRPEPGARLELLVRALGDLPDQSPSNSPSVLILASAVGLAADGRGADAATLLRWLRAEGYDLTDDRGAIAGAFAGALGDFGDGNADDSTTRASVWSLAIRACGADAAGACAIRAAMEAEGLYAPEDGTGADAAEALIGVHCAAGEVCPYCALLLVLAIPCGLSLCSSTWLRWARRRVR